MSESMFGFLTTGRACNMTQIKIDLESARSTLAQMDALSEECLEKVKTMNALAASLANCWKGDSGDAVQEIAAEWNVKQTDISERIKAQTAKVRKKLDAMVETDAALAAYIRNS